MVSTLVWAYRVVLLLYPVTFRRRYEYEMRRDFENALQEAAAGGATMLVRFACRQATDSCSSLLREWCRGTRVAIVAATSGITILLWGLALRPWAWSRVIHPLDHNTATTSPVAIWELVVVVIGAAVPVIALIVLAPRVVQGLPPLRRSR